MGTHTAGPWTINDARLLATGNRMLRIVAGLVGIARVNACLDDRANARLIAAAPKLLEALRPLAGIDLRPGGFDELADDQPIYARENSVITVGDVRRAIAAIAEATKEID